ncbi:MAG: serine hydrolase, partial [Bacteroidales bacterium]
MKKSTCFPVIFLMMIIWGGCQRADIIPTVQTDCYMQDSNSNHPKNAMFRAVIDKYIKLGLPGISVLVEDPSGVWFGTGGFADIAEGIPFESCHLSKAASITKMFNGALCMRLHQDGILNIDDPLTKYIDKKILDQIDNAEGKTIRQCLNHTTGIFDVITNADFYLAVLNNPNKQWGFEDVLKYVYGVPGYENTPYPAYYSNTNTTLVAMCMEKATGRNHADLLEEYIMEPLGLTSTYYQGHDEIPNFTAQGYFDLHSNGTISNVSNFNTASGNGYGGMFSNVFDLRTFARALLVEKTIVSPATLQEMHQFVQEDDDYFTGLGIVKKYTQKAYPGIGHTGKDLGYSANLFYFPDIDALMVFFVNYGTNGA